MDANRIESVLHSLGYAVGVLPPQSQRFCDIYPVRLGPVKADTLASQLRELSGRLGVKGIITGSFMADSSLYCLEVPKQASKLLTFSSIKANNSHLLPLLLGETMQGDVLSIDLAKAPHILAAGATGKGKSNGLHVWLCYLISHLSPEKMRLLLIDPKQVEFSAYNGIPHLLQDAITNHEQAVQVLNDMALYMDYRYEAMKEAKVSDLEAYNAKANNTQALAWPRIVLVIDELADLMISSKKACEGPIVRLAQMGRAAGIHLVVCTQRPSGKVLTDLIKANLPTRLAYAVRSHYDSMTILDQVGAEDLSEVGHALFSNGGQQLTKVISPYLSQQEKSQAISKAKTYGISHPVEGLHKPDETQPQLNSKDSKDNLANKKALSGSAYTSSGYISSAYDRVDDPCHRGVDVFRNRAIEAASALAREHGGLTNPLLLEHGFSKRKASKLIKDLIAQGILKAFDLQAKHYPLSHPVNGSLGEVSDA